MAPMIRFFVFLSILNRFFSVSSYILLLLFSPIYRFRRARRFFSAVSSSSRVFARTAFAAFIAFRIKVFFRGSRKSRSTLKSARGNPLPSLLSDATEIAVSGVAIFIVFVVLRFYADTFRAFPALSSRSFIAFPHIRYRLIHKNARTVAVKNISKRFFALRSFLAAAPWPSALLDTPQFKSAK